jgi:hypothetical protein
MFSQWPIRRVGKQHNQILLKKHGLYVDIWKKLCGTRTSQSIQTRGSVEREDAITRLGLR